MEPGGLGPIKEQGEKHEKSPRVRMRVIATNGFEVPDRRPNHLVLGVY